MMKTATTSFFFFTAFFIAGLTIAKAQYAEMAGKPYNQRLDAIHRLYWDVVELNMDTAAVADTLAGMRALANRTGDGELLLEADLLEAYYDYRNRSGKTDGLFALVQEGPGKNVAHVAYRAANVIASDFWEKEQYALAFRWYLRIDSLMRGTTVTEFPNKAGYLYDVGRAYYQFGDYKQAIRYFEQVAALPVADFYRYPWRHSINNTGLVYQHLGELDKSDSCFNRLAREVEQGPVQWQGIVAGNLGYNHYLRGNDDAAIPLFEMDIETAEQYEDYGLAAGSAIPLADILTRRGHLPQARVLLDKAYAYIQQSDQHDRLRHFYPVLSKWYTASGRGALAAAYLDSALAATKRHNEKFSALKLMRANQETMASQREAALQELRVESERQVNRRNGVLAILVVLVLLITFLTYRQRQRNMLRLRERDLRLLVADRELQQVRLQLGELARSASKKEQELRTAESREVIEQLNRQVVLTDEGWSKFSELFGKLYPGFQHRLKERYPSLTPAEIRCLAMEKLHYTNKEMAALQGISTNAVMVTKHRIRKKLGLASQDGIVAFVHAI